MIKVIVTNPKDFEKLQPIASYFSERTKVMTFDVDSSCDLYPVIAKYIGNVETKEKNDPFTITYNNGVYIISEDKELATYFDSWCKDGYIKIGVAQWWKAFLLLKYDVVKPDDAFKERFAPISKTKNNINEMKTWGIKVKFRKPDWNFRENAQKSLGFDGEKGIKIASCKFLTDSVAPRNYSIVTGYLADMQSDKKEALFKDEKGNVYNLKIKGFPYRFNSDVWVKNKKISFAYSGKSNEVYNPIIIPKCLNIEAAKFNDYLNEFGYLSNRCCPVELLNRLKAEVCIRLWMNNEKL